MKLSRFERIAGVLADSDRHHIILHDRETGENRSVRITGRNYYVRQTKMPMELGGIIVPDTAKEHQNSIMMVLAVGEGCGRWYEKPTPKPKGWKPQVPLIVDPLDRVLCPVTSDWGVMRSPYHEDEYFVNECVVEASFGRREVDDNARTNPVAAVTA